MGRRGFECNRHTSLHGQSPHSGKFNILYQRLVSICRLDCRVCRRARGAHHPDDGRRRRDVGDHLHWRYWFEYFGIQRAAQECILCRCPQRHPCHQGPPLDRCHHRQRGHTHVPSLERPDRRHHFLSCQRHGYSQPGRPDRSLGFRFSRWNGREPGRQRRLWRGRRKRRRRMQWQGRRERGQRSDRSGRDGRRKWRGGRYTPGLQHNMGSTNPAPGYVSGLFYTSGTIASDIWDTGASGQPWTMLSWQEILQANTDITFSVRASDTLFTKDNNTIPWIAVGGASPVKSGLPPGRYMQWRATLTTTSNSYTPVLHSIIAAASTSPDVSTNATTFVNSNGAVMNGTLSSIGLSSSTMNVNFYWGTTPGGPYPNSTAWQPLPAPGIFAAGLTGLSASTTYYFKARAWDGINPAVFGDEVSFRTSSVPPSVNTATASSLTSSSAILNGGLTSTGGAASVNVSFQWGTTPGGPYPNSTPVQAMTSTGLLYRYGEGGNMIIEYMH